MFAEIYGWFIEGFDTGHLTTPRLHCQVRKRFCLLQHPLRSGIVLRRIDGRHDLAEA